MRRFAILALASVALAGCNSNMAANNSVAGPPLGEAGNEAGPAETNAAETRATEPSLGSAGPAETAAPGANEIVETPVLSSAPPPPAPAPAPPPPPAPAPPPPPRVTMAAPEAARLRRINRPPAVATEASPPAPLPPSAPPPPPPQEQQQQEQQQQQDDSGNASAEVEPATPPPPALPSTEGAPAPAAPPPAAGDPLVYCDVSNDRIRASECAYNREAFSRLDAGRAALDVPQRMTRGQPMQVSLALTRAAEGHPQQIEDPEEHLDTKAEVTRNVRVGRRMGVILQGEGFTIAPAGLVERDLLAGDAARWDWTVTPTRGGRSRLTATAYAIVTSANGRRTERLLRAFHEDVEIDVAIGDRTRDLLTESKSWFELSTEVLVALTALIGTGLFGLWMAIRKFRRKPAGGGESGAGGEGGGEE